MASTAAPAQTPGDHAADRSTSHEGAGAEHPHTLRREPTREEKTAEAAAEGHDADIPSSMGYVLDERGEAKRRQSIARQRRSSTARRSFASDAAGARADDVEKGPANTTDDDGDAGGESSEDENVVWWDGPDDPENPYNWPSWRKVMTCVLISAMTFVTPLASCAYSPTVLSEVRRAD